MSRVLGLCLLTSRQRLNILPKGMRSYEKMSNNKEIWFFRLLESYHVLLLLFSLAVTFCYIFLL